MTAARELPKDFEALEATIHERHDELSAKLRDIAAFAIDHPDFMALETVARIAEQAGATPSSLIRFAQAIGFDGFSDMQKVFRTRLFARPESYVERLQRHDRANALDDIVEGFADEATENIAKLRSRLDRTVLREMAGHLASAGPIHVVAQRRSYPVAAYLHYGLLNLGKFTQLLDSGAGMSGRAMELVSPADTVLAISFKPYAPATLDAVAMAATRGALVLGIGDSGVSPLTRHCRWLLHSADPELNGVRGLSSSMLLAVMLVVATGRQMLDSDCVRERMGRGSSK